MLVVLILAASVFLIMLVEQELALRNEAVLRARGAIEPTGDVYPIMRWAYPGCFLAMAIEGAFLGPGSRTAILGGLVVFGLAKAVKVWAISSLGVLWSFRVLVLPGHPMIASGPYRFVSHPNYGAVLAELASFALIVWAPVTGALGLAGFSWLLVQRMRVEEQALGKAHIT